MKNKVYDVVFGEMDKEVEITNSESARVIAKNVESAIEKSKTLFTKNGLKDYPLSK